MSWENRAVHLADKWRPFGLVAGVSAVGLILGIVVGLFACSPGGRLTGAKEERYYVLAAKLYSQGESLDATKAYLAPLTSQDLSAVLTALADKYDSSSDEDRRSEAHDLRRLGEALHSSQGLLSSLERVPLPSATPLISQPAASGESNISTTPTVSPTPAPVPATPTSPAPQRPEPINGIGVAKPAGGGGAILREQPSTKSAWIASVPTGAKVEVLKVVEGEAVDPVEPRWYQVKYAGKIGYLYFKLIVQGE